MSTRHSVILGGLGLVTGFLSAFLGIGGGVILVPALTLGLGFSFKRAVGISLAAVVAISFVGVASALALQAAPVHWPLALVLTGASLIGARAGGRLMTRLPDGVLRTTFALLLALAALRLAGTGGFSGDVPLELALDGRLVAVTAVGAGAGLASVTLGVGGGIVTVPALLMLFPSAPFAVVAATSLVTVIPTSGLSLAQHLRLRTVGIPAVVRLAPSGIVGAVAGVLTAGFMPAVAFRLAFAALLVLVAVRTATVRTSAAVAPESPESDDVEALVAT